jgi:uncharacterized RDD family membrane protein YckC
LTVTEEATRVSVRRYFAHFIDGVLYTFVFVAVILFGAAVDGTVLMVVYFVLIALTLTVGHVWFLVLIHGDDGRSPGKRAAGIRVVDAQGNVPTRAQMWKRNWPIIIEYLYVIAWVGMMASPHRQRFGDRWAGTYVVRG